MQKFKNLVLWKKIVIIVAAVLVLGGIVTMCVLLPLSAREKRAYERHKPTAYTQEAHTKNCIHFLNTVNSDCMILESDGHIAIIDCGEDNDNPRNFSNLELEGYEDKVVRYVKEHFADESGNVYIDFIVGTHAHSDHIGGFDTLILDEKITVGKAYLKRYKPETIRSYEKDRWDNQEVYDQMVNAINTRGIELVQDIPNETFSLGEYKIRFLNTKDAEGKNLGENDNSIATFVTLGNKKALLMGDVNNDSGDEDEIAAIVGEVDLMKVGHHGYTASSTRNFIKTVSPEIAIVPNKLERMDPDNKRRIVKEGGSVYATYDENGILATFTEDGIKLYNNTMDGYWD